MSILTTSMRACGTIPKCLDATTMSSILVMFRVDVDYCSRSSTLVRKASTKLPVTVAQVHLL